MVQPGNMVLHRRMGVAAKVIHISADKEWATVLFLGGSALSTFPVGELYVTEVVCRPPPRNKEEKPLPKTVILRRKNG